MTDRERWTVYPLLFLALGITVKDKLAKLVDVDKVHCKSLILTDRAGKDRVVVTTASGTGLVHQRGDTWLAFSDNLAGLMLFDDHGRVRPWFATPPGPRHAPAPQSPSAPQDGKRGDASNRKTPAVDSEQPSTESKPSE